MANYKVPVRFVAIEALLVTLSANATKVQQKKCATRPKRWWTDLPIPL